MRVLGVILIICGLSATSHLVASEPDNIFSKLMTNEALVQNIGFLKDSLQSPRHNENISEKFLRNSQPRVSLECIVCRSAFGALFSAVRNGQSDEEATDTLVTFCISLGIQTAPVCKGAVALNVPIIAHIIRSKPEASADAFCGLILQNAQENVCPFNDSRFEWQVELPDKSDIVPPTPTYVDKPLKVAVITDAHIDPLYEAYGVAECDAPTCCRVGQNPRSLSKQLQYKEVLIKSNEIKNLSQALKYGQQKIQSHNVQSIDGPAPAGYWGDYRNCDTPLWAFDDAIDNIHENHNDIEVVYYVGDTIDHGVWETTYELINDMNRYVVEKIRKTFGDHVIVVPAIGNHEAQPTNQFAPSSVVGEKLNTTWLYQALVNKWGFYLPDEAKQTLLEQGDFSVLIRPGIRAISLNNNVAYRDNWWLVYDPLDVKKHLDWLVRELHKAELAGEKVHILAHIPPGVHDLIYTWTREYNRIVNRFSETIAAEFNGHTHADEFKVFYSPAGAPAGVAWGAGGVTAYTFYNLNYKIATFNPRSFVPERIVNYAYNLTEANLTPNRRPHWFLLYDLKNSYGLPDLSAQSMHNLIHSMVTDNRRLLDLYAAFTSKLSDSRWPYCNDNCKIDHVCRTVVTVLWDRERCDELRQLFFG